MQYGTGACPPMAGLRQSSGRRRTHMASRHALNVLVGVAVTAISGLLAADARAAFPGANGRIAVAFPFQCNISTIATLRPDGSDLRVLTPDVCDTPRARRDHAHLTAPDWSPDGRRLLLLRGAGWWFDAKRPMLMASDGSNRDRIPLLRPAGSSGLSATGGYVPSFAPDGSHFVYRRKRQCESGVADQIWRAALDGTGDQSLRDGFSPRWSPNGRVIAYIRPQNGSLRLTDPPTTHDRCSNLSTDGPGNGIWLMNARTGRDIRRLSSGEHPAEIDWSPDGSRLVVSDGRLRIAYADGRTGGVYVSVLPGSSTTPCGRQTVAESPSRPSSTAKDAQRTRTRASMCATRTATRSG
jgi:Tol biopolymer transport system component